MPPLNGVPSRFVTCPTETFLYNLQVTYLYVTQRLLIMEKEIIVHWFLPHPPLQVWECLTDPALLGQWLMPNDFRAEVGHRFRFHSQPRVKMGWDGIVYAEVKEVQAPHRLVYTWQGGPKPGVINLDTVITWTLEAREGGTALTLTQAGFKGWKNVIAAMIMSKGWKGKIAARFAGLLNERAHVPA